MTSTRSIKITNPEYKSAIAYFRHTHKGVNAYQGKIQNKKGEEEFTFWVYSGEKRLWMVVIQGLEERKFSASEFSVSSNIPANPKMTDADFVRVAESVANNILLTDCCKAEVWEKYGLRRLYLTIPSEIEGHRKIGFINLLDFQDYKSANPEWEQYEHILWRLSFKLGCYHLGV